MHACAAWLHLGPYVSVYLRTHADKVIRARHHMMYTTTACQRPTANITTQQIISYLLSEMPISCWYPGWPQVSSSFRATGRLPDWHPTCLACSCSVRVVCEYWGPHTALMHSCADVLLLRVLTHACFQLEKEREYRSTAYVHLSPCTCFYCFNSRCQYSCLKAQTRIILTFYRRNSTSGARLGRRAGMATVLSRI